MSVTCLGIDPSLTCTGYALVESFGVSPPRIVMAGTIKPKKGHLAQRVIEISEDVRSLIRTTEPHMVVVELPFATARGGPHAKRSDLTLPNMGMCIGAVLYVAHDWCFNSSRSLVCTPSDEWTRGMKMGKQDEHKTGRVRAAAYLFNMTPEEFGAKTVAGNVADAALMAEWALRNHK